MANEEQLGVTPPISKAFPNESEKLADEKLFLELKAQNTYEHATETAKRESVLKNLQKIADVFVKAVAVQVEPDNAALHRGARGHVFTFGSYRLGVFGPGSDIDTLVVAPKYVTSVDFFKRFPALLEQYAPPGAIADLTAVTDAYVPIIKFEYFGISIDLIFCALAMTKELPPADKFDIKDNTFLRGLNGVGTRSLNGTRVTDMILQLVPEVASFRLALRAIKLWAQKRAIYANVVGYPGGVAWAMLVARVCQLYPKANGAVIVNKFFHIIRRWPWPQPVLLTPVVDNDLDLMIWNPKLYKRDSYHLMPIITPAYPSMNSTFNITPSGKAVIQKELEHFAGVTDQIMLGQRPWKDLFVKHTFFTRDYKYYIVVNAVSMTKENSNKWGGFVQSKIRLLVRELEAHQSIKLVRPFNKGKERAHRCKENSDGLSQILNGSMDYVVDGSVSNSDDAVKPKSDTVKTEPTSPTKIKEETVDIEDAKIKDDKPDAGFMEIHSSTHYIGLELYEGAKSLDLSYQVNSFKDTLFSWDKYKEELDGSCFVGIQHIRNWALPDDMFEPGEIKPTRALKKANGAKKRKAASSEDAPAPLKRQQTSVGAG